MGDKEDIFDGELRSLMEDVEEAVPKRVWSGLSERLVAEGLQAAKPVLIPLWARWTSAGVAVAAAVVLGVFLFVHSGEDVIEEGLIAEVVESPSEEILIAESVENDGVGASIADAAGVLGSNEDAAVGAADATGSDEASDSEFGVVESYNVLASNETDGESSEEVAEVSLAEQIAESPKYIAEATDVANATEVADVTEVSKPWTDPFAEDGSTRKSNKTRTALTVSGNAFGNSNTSSGSSSTGIRRQMSSSIDGQPAAGITEKSDSNYGIPASFGFGVKILFTPRWSLGVGVNYSLLSRTFSGDYTSYDADGEASTESYSNIRHRVDYIGIPVNAYFSIVQSHAIDFYVYAGGTVEKAVSSRYILEKNNIYKESVKGLQCSVDFGVGIEFLVIDQLGIYIDPNLRYYFPNSHQPNSIRMQGGIDFGFEIGLRLRL
ncbi:MAG: PorT family protein [Bacteroidales bacterium]|nr:PorT family protein [Bacteroidales bacterium]